MRRIITLINLLFFLSTSGCTAGFFLQTDPNPLISSVVDLSPTTIPSDATGDLPLTHTSVEPSRQADFANISSPTPTAITQLSAPEARQAFEPVSILEKTSMFRIPYDEEYTFQIDTSIWQPVIILDEGEWLVRQITTIQPPNCTIEIKTSRDESSEPVTVEQKQNRYRSMGTFATGKLVFDLTYYTSDVDGLADTQHVFYILTSAGSDKPYLVKPLFHAFSAYEDWEHCRPLVRSVLSTLVMKRVPVAP